jgi:OPA family glycerol-3-phosphate transporter-like MFS transporter
MLSPILLGLAIALFASGNQDNWRVGFIFIGIIVSFISILLFIFMRETPQEEGLPPIEDFRNDKPLETHTLVVSNDETILDITIKYIFKNKKFMFWCLYGAFVYILRYGALTWAPRYLYMEKGLPKLNSLLSMAFFEFGGIIGMLLTSIVCVKFFKNSKPKTSAVLIGFCMFFLAIYYITPPGQAWAWLDYTCLAFIGLSIYGPVMYIALYGIDLVPKKAAGIAKGITGTFSYVLGGVFSQLGLGIIADSSHGWNGVFAVFFISGILCIVFALLGRDKKIENAYNMSLENHSN